MKPADDREPDPVGATDLRPDEPLTDELCLFVHSLLLDGRPVPDALARRVRAHVAQRPELQRAVDDFARHGAALRALPTPRAPAGFTERVLAARRRELQARRRSPPTLRRLAAAAALLLAASLVWDVTHPAALQADDRTAHTRWVVDELQPDPFGPPRIAAALRARLPGPLDDAPPGRTPAPADRAPAGEPPAAAAPGPDQR